MTHPAIDQPAAPATHSTPRRFTTHDGLSLAYDDIGKPDGDPIVFLHGGTDSRLTWGRVTPAVGDTHRVLLLDARGQGDSDADPEGYDFVDSFAGDVIALCEHALDRPAVLVGASHGGVIAPAVAGRRPDLVRGLLLLDPPLFGRIPPAIGDVFATIETARTAIASSDDQEAALRSLLAAAPSLTGEGTMAGVLGADGLDSLAFAWSQVDLRFVQMCRTLVAHDEPFGVAAAIACPVLVVRADPAGWATCFRGEHEDRLRQLAPQAQLVVAEGSSHMIHHERPAWVADQLTAFLSSL